MNLTALLRQRTDAGRPVRAALIGAGKFGSMFLSQVPTIPGLEVAVIADLDIERAKAACREVGCEVVVVIGHPGYYPRFGFAPASRKGLSCEFPVPDEVFMVAELTPGALGGRRGLVRYRPEFSGV